ncbi:zinc finger protein 502-like [Fopius arisanus]|uniref:Zinc finger protein 502-like n=2 Tax=Fopius arisanus TaxID=64838 RepID=A0A9R1SU99_9HYME|nr:PREDICTED: zinc finger protein 502-like [Fopius arisanus]
MERSDNEQYVTYSLSSVHDIEQAIISHEEVCEPAESLMNHESQEEILCEKSSDEDDNSVVYPMYIKQEGTPQYTSGDDESMAVEALRQLGGMYPQFDGKKTSNYKVMNTFKDSEIDENNLSPGDNNPFDYTDKNIGEDGESKNSCPERESEPEPESEGVYCRKNSGKFSCQTCGDKFERRLDLNNHMVCHQVDRPHACRTCGNLFRSKSSLHTHMSQVHNNQEKCHKCSICGANFQRPSSLSNHMKIHTYVAGRALMSQSDNLSESSSVVPQQNYQVAQVNWQSYAFQSDQSDQSGALGQDKLDLQEFTVLPNGEVAQFEYPHNYNISLVSNSFPTNSETLVKAESLPFDSQKKTCQFVTVQVTDQKQPQFTCNNCGATFSRATSLTSHQKIHNQRALIPAKSWTMPIECQFCDKQFQDNNHLASHHTTCAKKLMLNNGGDNANGNGKWSKHACNECGKKFTTKQKMFRHQWIHRKKTHSCEVCGGQFEKQNQLDKHRLSAHPGISPFTCSECGKCFVSRQGLWEHTRTHADGPAHFQCDTCSKTFSSRQGYLIHHRTHTGERPYGCKFCWKAFRDGGTLRKHERIHTGERPHVCPLCSRAFNQKVVLREHVRWVHAAGKNDTEVVGPPFPCPLCGALNQDRDELCAHIVKHSDQMIAEAKARTTIDPMSIKSVKKKANAKRKAKTDLSKQKIAKVQVEGHLIQKDGETVLLVSTGEQPREEGEKQIISQEHLNDVLRVQFIDDRQSTLQIISKENEALPVLTLPNEDDGFAGQVEATDEGVYQESDDEPEMDLICGICGDEFGDKNILMEHVKIHI